MKPTYLESAVMNLCQDCLRITQGEPIRTPTLAQIPGARHTNITKAIKFVCGVMVSSKWDWETPCELCQVSPTVTATVEQASSSECSLHANAISKEVAVSLMSPLLTDDERSRLVSFLYWLNFHAVSNWVDDPLLAPRPEKQPTPTD